MTEDDSHLSMIDKWSDSMDDVWAKVLNEDSDDESRGESPVPLTLDLDQTLDTALSTFNEDNVDGLGCILDSFFLTLSPEEEKVLVKKQSMQAPHKPKKMGRDLGLPPRPSRKKAIRPKPKEDTRQEDTKEDNENGFFSFMYGSASSPNDAREEVPLPDDDATSSAKEADVTAPVPLVRRISFRRVSSSFRRSNGGEQSRDPTEEEEDDEDFFGEQNLSKSSPAQDESTNEPPKAEVEGPGFFSSMFAPQEETSHADEKKARPQKSKTSKSNEDNSENYYDYFSAFFGAEDDSANTSSSKPKPSLAKKFSRGGSSRISSDTSVHNESLSSVRLVKRNSFRRQRSGSKSESLRSLQAERF